MSQLRWKKNGRGSLKKQWYFFYIIVLIIPLVITIFSYSFSYRLLAEDTYERQREHLISIRNLLDSEFRSIQQAMSSFGLDETINSLIPVKDFVAEGKMQQVHEALLSAKNASVYNDLVEDYVLYFPASDYLVIGGYLTPRRSLDWDGYPSILREAQFKEIIGKAVNGSCQVTASDAGDLLVYTKLPMYSNSKTLYAIAIVSSSALENILDGWCTNDESAIYLESYDETLRFTNNNAVLQASLVGDEAWFHVSVDSEALPVRYGYDSPVRIVEEKLTSYLYVLALLFVLSVVLAGVAMVIVVRKQYAPIENLMQHFATDDGGLQNEFQSISRHLLHVREKNEQHFLVDMLQGNIHHTETFPCALLLLLAPADEPPYPLPQALAAHPFFCATRLVKMHDHTVVLIQHSKPSQGEIAALLQQAAPDVPLYAVYMPMEGQSLHSAYSTAVDTLLPLRFFHRSGVTPIQAVHHSGMPSPAILRESFEDALRTAVFERNAEKADQILRDAFDDLAASCHSGSLLRSCLYAMAIIFMRLEAAVRERNAAIPDGIAGNVVKGYQYTSIEALKRDAALAIRQMTAALDTQSVSPADILFSKINEFIRQNYTNPDMNLALICSTFGYSSTHITQLYKQRSSVSIPDAILRARINAAKPALQQTDSKVSDVAIAVGFINTGTFIRCFKKLESMTPGAYKSKFSGG